MAIFDDIIRERPIKKVNVNLEEDHLDFEAERTKKADAKIIAERKIAAQIAEQQRQAQDPKNWTIDQTKKYIKENPPKTPEEETNMQTLLKGKQEQQKQVINNRLEQSGIKQVAGAASEAIGHALHPQTLLNKVKEGFVTGAQEIMPLEEWEKLGAAEVERYKNLPKDVWNIARVVGKKVGQTSIEDITKAQEFLTGQKSFHLSTPLTEEERSSALRGVDTLLKPLQRPAEMLRSTLSGLINKKDPRNIAKDAVLGFLKPEEVKTITSGIPFQEFEQKGTLGLIPRAVTEAIESMAVYHLTYGRPIKTVKEVVRNNAQQQGLEKIKNSLSLLEKNGVKFPAGMKSEDKIIAVLQSAQQDPRVGKIVQNIITTPNVVYGGGPSTKRIMEIANRYKLSQLQTKNLQKGIYTGLSSEVIDALSPPVYTVVKGNLKPTEELMQDAKKIREVAITKQEVLDTTLKEVAAETGTDYVGKTTDPKIRTKSVKSMALKVARKQYGGDLSYGIESISDHARDTILLNTWEDIPKVMESFSKKGQFTLETMFSNPHPSGYKGIFLKTKLGDGIGGEIQVHTKESWALKVKTDVAYREWREKAANELTVDDKKRILKVRQDVNKQYEDFYSEEDVGSLSNFESFINRSASSSGIEVESSMLPTTIRGTTQDFLAGEKALKSKVSKSTPVSESAKRISPIEKTSTTKLPQEEGDVNVEFPFGENELVDKVETAYIELVPAEKAAYELEIDNIRKTPEGNLFVAIRKLGKIKPHEGELFEEMSEIPASLKSKTATNTLDQVVSEIKKYGWEFETEEELRQAIIEQAQNPEPKVNRGELQAIIKQAEKNEALKQKIWEGSTKRRKFIKTVKGAKKTVQEVASQVESRYTPITNQATLDKAREFIKTNYNEAVTLVEGPGEPTAFSNAVAISLIDEAQQAGKFADAIRWVERTAEKATAQGQAIQALAMYERLTPEGILQYANKIINQAKGSVKQKERMEFFNKEVKKLLTEPDKVKLAKKLGVPYLSEETAAKLVDMAKKIQGMPPGRDKQIETALMLKEIAKQIPITLGRKISMIQTMAQLLNPKTFIRNILGNLGFQVTETIADTIGTTLDIAASLVTGKRTVWTPDLGVQLKGMLQGLKEGTQESLLGISLKKMGQRFDLPQNSIFDKGVLGGLEKTMSVALKATDQAFYQASFNQSIRQQTKAAGIDEPTGEMIERAHQLGLFRTYQDDNVISRLFVNIKKALNLQHDFGLGDMVLKYPKTPANLLARGLEYSPFGFVKTINTLVKPLLKKGWNQEDFVRSTSRAFLGSTLLVGVGAILASMGIITGKRSRDRDVRATERAAGVREYQINTDALKRFVMSGMDPDQTTLRKGDTLINYDWMLPSSIGLALGSNMVFNKDGISLTDEAINFADSIMAASETLAEQPVVSGVKTLTRKEKISEGLSDVAKGIPASFMPTLLNQIGQLTDNVQRNTKDPNYFKEVYNKAIVKIPILRETLPPRVSTLGEQKQMYQLGSNNPFNVFLNPAFVNKYEPDKVSEMVLDVWENSGETIHFPRVVSAKIKIGDEYRELSAAQYLDYQKYVGNRTDILFTILADNEGFMSLPDETKAKELQGMLTDINTAAKIELFGHRPKSVSKDVLMIIKHIDSNMKKINANTPIRERGIIRERSSIRERTITK